MRIYALAVYLFLYIPIGIIALFSFNAGKHASQFTGFSVQWYGKALDNPFVTEAFQTSLIVALSSALLATVFGTMAALALQSVKGRLRMAFDALIYIAVMVPGIVIGIATLIALVTVFDWLNPILAALWPMADAAPQLALGYGSLIAAHGLFSMALVIIIVRARVSGMDRSLIEASADLGATPWGTFRQVTLPQIFPGILAGFLLAFTFSFDDFIIAFFVAGSQTTLPIYVFSSIRRGVTPEINAIGSMVLAVSLILLITAQSILQRGRKA
ncbi:MAG: ABC transporter permease [Rhodobacterales bacterium RIFCSPHIGHO2_02_FULL_62_130]|jgi:spermidine/putrescine transport system permease protein|nr:MAG: ABC transporter permease [Rhodobacterales bacterium RIFCSPHIGHO2_02_FULL_62_130]OHC58863.1 MAG: ABC transporter permease [Rhodobacterales bacterium RIFCSPHIGHO2_12_FULL_62_75]HCZ00583.1 ABC transporter permease [Rhodobacter sp.]